MVSTTVLALVLSQVALAGGKPPVVRVNGIEVGDPHRWLEDSESDEAVAWWKERDAATRAKIADSAQVDQVSALVRSWMEERSAEAHLVDAAGSTTLWAASSPSGRDPSEAGVEHQDLWRGIYSVRATPESAPQALTAAGADSTLGLCGGRLDPKGEYVAWGRRERVDRDAHSREPASCALFVTEVATGEAQPLFEGNGAQPEWSPDGSRLLIAHREGRKQELVEVRRDGEELARRFRGGLSLWSDWVEDDTVVVSAHRKTGGRPLRQTRIFMGPSGALELVGYVNVRPQFGRAYPLGLVDDQLLLKAFRSKGSSFEVVAVDPDEPWLGNWATVVRPQAHERLLNAQLVDDRVYTVLQSGGWATIQSTPVLGGPSEPVEIPGLWTHFSFVGDRVLVGHSPAGEQAWSLVEGGVEPLPFYGLDPTLVVEQIAGRSADGTLVPVSLVRRRDTPRDGTAPTWVDVYGGFGISQGLTSGSRQQLWLSQGGVLAVAHVRGGNELGDMWHAVATKDHRNRTFEDVIAAAEGLVDAGWTAPGRLVLSGASNGGLTVSNAARLRPDLFGAVVSSAGVYDLLRGPRLEGHWWSSEYGDIRWQDGEEMATILDYSTAHALPERLPPMLVITGESDPRVPPSHSYKLVAAWEHLPGGPVDLLVDPRGTHGADPTEGTPPEQYWGEETTVAMLTWVFDALGIELG